MFNRVSKKEIDHLIKQATLAMNNALATWSPNKVGAAVLTYKGNIYEGCNIQLYISGLGTCAERSAISHMVAHGEYQIKAIAIISNFESITEPCGMCREMIMEFAQITGKDIEIIMTGDTGKIKRTTIKKMLPFRDFSTKSIESFRQYNK